MKTEEERKGTRMKQKKEDNMNCQSVKSGGKGPLDQKTLHQKFKRRVLTTILISNF